MSIDWGKVKTAETKTAEALKILRGRVAAARYSHEVKGIVVNGMAVDTGRDSQGLVAGACLAAVIDSNYSVNWKCQDGTFLVLDSTQIIAVATAIRAHVQACFDREHIVLQAIEDNTFTEELLLTGWPGDE